MKPSTLRYLSRADVEKVALPMSEIIERLERMFREKGEGRTEMPPKPGVHPGGHGADNFIHAMPALIERMGAVGMKWVSGFPGNVARGLPYITGLIILNDLSTGLPNAVLDASWVTAMRTGAATGVACKVLARKDASRFAIVGCGVQGRTNLEAVAEVLPGLSEVRAFDIDAARTRAYLDEMRPRYPRLSFHEATSPRDAIEGADVIVTAGPIRVDPEPVLEAEWLKVGALGVPLDYDSYWKPAAMRSAARLYTDDRGQLLHTQAAGVYFGGIPALYADLGEVIAGKANGRRDDDERLLCMNMGIALEDMAIAPEIVRRARERGIGVELER